MRYFKKFAAMASALALAACAVAPLGMNAFAVENEISFSGETVGTHSYTAIKVFSGIAEAGNLGGAENVELTHIDWAKANETTDEQISAFIKSLGEKFTNCKTAVDVAGVLKAYGSNSAEAKAFADTVVANKTLFKTFDSYADNIDSTKIKINVNEDGYYVIEETALTPDTNGSGSKTAYILGVYAASAGAEVKVKASLPTLEKKIKDTNASTGEVTAWQDSADYNIGDAIPFQLKATLPETYDTYKQYKLVFHDDLNKSNEKDVFSIDSDSVVVYVDINKNGVCDDGEALTKETHYTVITTNKTESDFDCDLEVAIPNLKGDNVTITGINKDTPVYVEYKATLTDDAVIGNPGNWNDAYLEYSNNPNYNGEGDEETGTTPKDSVVAFTYAVEINKTDGTTKQPLAGAEFTLSKLIKATVEGDEDTWTDIDVVKAESGTTFTFNGLDDGEYRLKETATPANYSPINDMYFTITATHATEVTNKSVSGILTEVKAENKKTQYTDETETKESAPIELVSKVANDNGVNGNLSATIENNSGASLPGTGGIGTTIFYVGGGAMVAVAGIFLITKKRMGKKEE